MSQFKQERTNSEDESIVQFLLEKIPQIDAVMIINDGKLTKYTISKSFEDEIDLKEGEYSAKLR